MIPVYWRCFLIPRQFVYEMEQLTKLWKATWQILAKEGKLIVAGSMEEAESKYNVTRRQPSELTVFKQDGKLKSCLYTTHWMYV